MLQGKDIKNICELKNGFTHRWVEPDFIASSLKLFSFSQLSKVVSEIKQKGYSFEWIMTLLLSMPFIGAVTVNSMLNGFVRHHIEAGKDTFYRLKNDSQICWRLLLWLFASKFKNLANGNLKQVGKGLKCMVLDDTLLKKTGKRIEKVSRVFDHVTRRYVLGFKLLLMGYWDGVSFIPVDFSLHRELGTNKEKPFGLKKKELKKQAQKKRDKGTPAYERENEADESKITNAIKMFKRAISLGFVIDYVLIDSWFTCEALIDAVLGVKKCAVHLIGMYKIVKTKFLFQGKKLTYNQIRNMLGKPKRCRKLKLYYLEAEVDYNGKPIKLFFSKKGVNGKWKVFVCTNTRLSFVEMIEIYQIRWTIEVFFKESKQLLGLGRCQSNDFDAQIADATITMIQHILLTMQYRIENYESMQGLFSEIAESAIKQRLDRRLWGLFIEILNIIESLFDGIDEDELIKRIFNDETAREKIARLLDVPEKQKITA
ncbi:MAG: transposase [Ignavibacterium sp.]|nr:transposase [Ignavibacterium sp.]